MLVSLATQYLDAMNSPGVVPCIRRHPKMIPIPEPRGPSEVFSKDMTSYISKEVISVKCSVKI